MIRLLAQMLTLFGLGTAIIGLAASAIQIWQSPIALDPPATAIAAPGRAPQPIADPEKPVLSTFSQSLGRPLFFEGRRLPSPPPKPVKAEAPKPPPPAPPPPPPPPKPATLPDKIRLLGVVMQAEDRKALIEIPPQAAAWFKIGDKIADWTITAIEENRILFSHNSSTTATLALYSEITSK
jgi:hypothetical protein